MDVTFTKKREQIGKMLSTLQSAITLYKQKCAALDANIPETVTDVLAYRDSLIQRLEYCTDGFWKILKLYMEGVGITLEELSPKAIARTAALHRVITEVESAQLIDLIKARNQTSHMYREEIADEIAKQAPGFLLLMQTILDRLNKKIDGDKAHLN